ncbi:hypothetical protein BH23CHL10_BH23CHL10_05700 [soil metagenome]
MRFHVMWLVVVLIAVVIVATSAILAAVQA